MVNNSSNTHVSTKQTITSHLKTTEHKDHNIWRWKSRPCLV